MLSEDGYKDLSQFVLHRSLPEPTLHISPYRLSEFVEEGYIRRETLVPPSKESEYPYGLSGYTLTDKGNDALCEYRRQCADRDTQKKRHWQSVLIPTIASVVTAILVAVACS